MKNPQAQLIDAETSLLLVIDLQEKFVPYLHQAADVIHASTLMLQTAITMKLPIIVSEHNPKRIGATIPEIQAVSKTAITMKKQIFSAVADNHIMQKIQSYPDVKNIIICGCETHICVCQTCLEALNAGYNVHIAHDAVSSRLPLDRQIGIDRMRAAGAVITSAEMFAYELLRGIERPEFKEMLPYFKTWTMRNN